MKREVSLSGWRVEISLNVVHEGSASVRAMFTSTDNNVKHRYSLVFFFVNDNAKAQELYQNFEPSLINQIIAT